MQGLLRRSKMFTLTAGLIALLFNLEAHAQESSAQKTNISDEELKVFVKAYVQVDEIRLAYEPSLRNAQGPEQAQNIQREATGKWKRPSRNKDSPGKVM